MKCAVVGGAGFIGHHIVNRLIKEGHEVIVVDNFSTGVKENCNPQAITYVADITEDFLEPFFEDVDVVFLTAAKARVQPSIKDPISFNKTNVEGTLKVLFAAHRAGVKRVVYSASSSCYGDTNIFPTSEDTPTNPLSPYGLQKFIGEQYCRMFSQVYGLDTVCLRYFNVYGSGMPLTGAYRTVVSIFGDQYKNDKPYTITNDGEQRRDFTHVDDVVDANIRAAMYEDRLDGQSFNIRNGDNCSVNEVVRMFDKNAKIDYFKKVLEPKQTLADNDKARRTFGWIPKGNLNDFIQTYKQRLKNG
jgi:UDP-glucose 4-epimerase